MQQKYWDQGRSVALLTTTRPIFRPGALAERGKSDECVNLAVREPLDRLRGGSGDPADIPSGIEADVREHAREEGVYGPPTSLTATVFPFRSRIVRTRSQPKSSKQPAWTPPRITIGSPASILGTGGNERRLDIGGARPSAASGAQVLPGMDWYCTSVKPSAATRLPRRSSALACRSHLGVVVRRRSVSGGGSP